MSERIGRRGFLGGLAAFLGTFGLNRSVKSEPTAPQITPWPASAVETVTAIRVVNPAEEEDVLLSGGPHDGTIYRLKTCQSGLYMLVVNHAYKVEPDGPLFRYNPRYNEWESAIPPMLVAYYVRAMGETDATGRAVFRYKEEGA